VGDQVVWAAVTVLGAGALAGVAVLLVVGRATLNRVVPRWELWGFWCIVAGCAPLFGWGTVLAASEDGLKGVGLMLWILAPAYLAMYLNMLLWYCVLIPFVKRAFAAIFGINRRL
jgi:hypothetical protein